MFVPAILLWITVFAGMLWMQSYGAYTVLLQDEFGWSKAVVAGAFALTRVESGILRHDEHEADREARLRDEGEAQPAAHAVRRARDTAQGAGQA